ncbi:hypothetical protein HLB23_27515 [Nocardia uniformis]|uniref:Mce-associated membrane protein n=1 Tax=Nocardia uniformis TaxID=53432 RepID=A0A849CI96_9NOCA|nr:hypothetical protein [Nocardia uniformis]NNH73561.1 hypothetical protein [Nocardia uniformis]
MSDTSGVKKTRRRAVRTEGPPPDEQTTTSQVYEATVPVTETAAVELGKPVVGLDKKSDETAAKVAAAETVKFGKTPVEGATERIPQAPAAPAEAAAQPPVPPAAAAESEAPAAASAGTGFGWERIVAAAAVVLAIALMVGTGFLINLRNEAADEAALRADYIQTAKQTMLNITNISAETAADDIKRVLEVTSGDLATEYEQRKDDYAGIVQKAEVKAKGEVIDAAIESSDDNTAIVLVAVKQTLTNAGAEGPQQRQFRFRVTIAHTEKGLAATQMEMVV